jgi:5'-3' exonuclease
MDKMKIPLNKNHNVILIDAGYFMFYRYFATLKWYTFKKQDQIINVQDLHNTREFIEGIENHAMKDIERLKKKWNTKNVIICLDTPRHMIWRMKLFKEYKDNRNNDSVNKIALKHLIPFIQDYELAQFLGEDYLEADDIIYILANKILSMPDFTNNIIVITNDNDYLQMRGDRIQIYNLQGKDGGYDISTRAKGNPSIDLMIKILKGDVSDNIQSICPKLGIKTAMRVALMSEEDRIEWIKMKGEEALNNYYTNKKLIDFKEIPKELCDSLTSKFEVEFR